MEIADQEKGLEFLDLRIKCVEGKLFADVFAKPTCKNIVMHIRILTTYHVDLLLDYSEYVTLMRSLNFVLKNISNIK